MSRIDIPHPLTRASTAQDSEPVVTPTDITPGYEHKGGFAGGPVIRDQRSVGSTTPGSSYLQGIPEGLGAIGEDRRYDPEPFGPYFSLPTNHPAPTTSLARRTTTKELIKRYELLDSATSDYTTDTGASSPHDSNDQQSNPKGAEKKVKGRSPIRQSFRNILSAIGKRAKGLGKDHSTNGSSKSPYSICLDSPPLPSSSNDQKFSGTYLDIPSPADLSKTSSSGMPACNTPTALHVGPLLYLNRPDSSEHLPVWTSCNATLHSSHILVTWLTSQENPSTFMVTLASCTDVRSLALSDLDATEKSLLPTQPNTGELKVFELLFEGRAREKFAAYSVTGRASWVSAIWDAVLLCQDRKSSTESSSATNDTLPVDSYPAATSPPDVPASSTPPTDVNPAVTSPSVVPSGYHGDASSVGRSPYASSSETDSRTTSTGSSSVRSETQSQDLLSPRSFLSPVSPGTTSTILPNSPYSSIGFQCRTDTSALSPRPSLDSRSGVGSPISPISSRLTSRPASTLPALPTPPMPAERFSLYDPPVSRASSATPTKSSLLQTPSSTRSQSPSIMNLSQTSVVKQRLAEIERTNSLTSQTPSTPRSSRSRQYSPLPQSPLSLTSTRKKQDSPSLRVDTSTYSEEESIINSYAESHRGGSPLSVFAGRSDRLTSVPSRQGTVSTRLTEAPSTSQSTPKRGVSESGDVCSPTSEYSSAFLSPLPTPQRMPFASINEVVETLQGKLAVEISLAKDLPETRLEDVAHKVASESPLPRLTRISSPQQTQRYVSSPKAQLHVSSPKTQLHVSSPKAHHQGYSPGSERPTADQNTARLTRINEPAPPRQVQHLEDITGRKVAGPLIFQSHGIRAETPEISASVYPEKSHPGHVSPPPVPSNPRLRSVDEAATTAGKTPIVWNEPTPTRPSSPRSLAPRYPAPRTSAPPPQVHLTLNVPASHQHSPSVPRYIQSHRVSPVSPVFVDLPPPPRNPPSPVPRSVVTGHESIPSRAVVPPSPKPALSSLSIPPVVQKTPLMVALESPGTYWSSRVRGPPRPTRLTKPPLLANSSPAPSLVGMSVPVITGTPQQPPGPPEPRALPPAEYIPIVQKDLPRMPLVDAATKTSRPGGLFAALRRQRRRSAEASAQSSTSALESHPTARPAPSAPQSHMSVVPDAPPIVQVVKEVVVERIPASPIIQVDEETKHAIQNVQGTVTEIIEHENWNGEQLTGIRTQVDTVLHELRQMPKPTSRIIQPPPPAIHMPPPIDVTQITNRLDKMGSTLNANIPELFGKVEELMKQAAALQNAKSVVVMRNVSTVTKVDSPKPDCAPVVTAEPFDVPEMPGTMTGPQERGDSPALDMADDSVTPSSAEEIPKEDDPTEEDVQVQNDDTVASAELTKLELFDPTQLEAKLDALLSLFQQLRTEPRSQMRVDDSSQHEEAGSSEAGESEPPAGSGTRDPETTARDESILEILELLKDDLDHRVAHSEQQTDSVRYLHELNSWLEAFVNHGTSQIDNVLAGVQHLCRELAPVPELQMMHDLSGEAADGSGIQEPPASNLLTDIRKLLAANQEREGNTLALEVSVNGLVAAVQEDLRRSAESRNTLTTEAIVGLIERHRQDQERLLRNVASDLSNDIRGERLRFVEAMKEATAINVQIHVEEFKKELTREVLIMTQEVGRLQKERQSLEQQIADLFSFYAKQKQSGSEARANAQRVSAPRMQHPKPIPSMRRRPLPTPSPRPPSALGRGA